MQASRVGSISVSRDVTLRDILQKPITNTVGIVIDAPLSVGSAQKLVTAIRILASNVQDLRYFSFIILCICSRRVASIILKGLSPLKGLKNIAIMLNNKPGPASAEAERVALALKDTGPSFAFTFLPPEIRQEILSYCLQPPGQDSTILISPDLPKKRHVCCRQCLPSSALNSGYCACPRQVGGYSTTCTCQRNTFATFRVCKMLYKDSTSVCFGLNRFVLHGNPEILKFLRSLPDEALHAMRKLDILIKLREFHMYDYKVPSNFEEVVHIIFNKCNLPALHLALDSGPEEQGDQFTYKQVIWHSYDFVGEWLMTALVNISTALLPLGAVKRLEIFLPNCSELETKLEKAIMGEDYDAYKLGKIKYSHRDPLDPHQYILKSDSGKDLSEESPIEPKSSSFQDTLGSD